MSNRNTRATVAHQTLEILDRGGYATADGRWVSLSDSLVSATQATRLYRPEDLSEILRPRARGSANSAERTRFRVINATTLSCARRLIESNPQADVLCHNFASAKKPGGGFLGGSQAQEESLARASGLYRCIAPTTEYYDANWNCGTCLYTDHMIYAPRVPVFRDDQDQLLEEPYCISMITAPAVNAGAVRRNEPHNVSRIAPVMIARIEKLLSIAVIHGHRQMVLGAWGCGVFRNDPANVADWFHQHLGESGSFADAFELVVFAVLTPSDEVIRPFYDAFGNDSDLSGGTACGGLRRE